MKDRSIVFPVFSGLFLAIKWGGIEQDDNCQYEQELVALFVEETKVNGDHVHYARALAMQAEMYARLGKLNKAFESFEQLKSIYDADLHSQKISEVYGSDR